MIVCVIFLALGALLIVPIPFSVLGHISALPRTFGGVSFRVFGKSVFAARMNIRSSRIIFTTVSGKQTEFKLSTDTGDENSVASHLDNGVVRVMHLRRIECYTVCGVENNAMATAITVSAAQASIGAISAYLCTRSVGLSFRDYYEPNYDSDRLQFSFRASAAMSIIDMIFAYAYAIIQKIKRGRSKHESNNV